MGTAAEVDADRVRAARFPLVSGVTVATVFA
jgi:hypothetical protein